MPLYADRFGSALLLINYSRVNKVDPVMGNSIGLRKSPSLNASEFMRRFIDRKQKKKDF